MDVAFCAAGSHIKAPLFNSQSPMVKLNGWQWNWRPTFFPVHTLCFKNGYWRWLKSSSSLFCSVSTRLNVVFFARVWKMSLYERLIENASWKYISEYTTKSTSKSTTDNVLLACKKLTVKAFFSRSTVFRPTFVLFMFLFGLTHLN